MYACLVEGCAEVFQSSGKRHKHLVDSHRYPESFDFSRYALFFRAVVESGVNPVLSRSLPQPYCMPARLSGFKRAYGLSLSVTSVRRHGKLLLSLSLPGIVFDPEVVVYITVPTLP